MGPISQCLFLTSLSSLGWCNTLAYWGHSKVVNKMKYCECGPVSSISCNIKCLTKTALRAIEKQFIVLKGLFRGTEGKKNKEFIKIDHNEISICIEHWFEFADSSLASSWLICFCVKNLWVPLAPSSGNSIKKVQDKNSQGLILQILDWWIKIWCVCQCHIPLN